ncbi:MAG: lipid A export permease/ATP-binding protein MsbA [Candidatus Thiodiazotropha sp. (ex Semelilucina semeliformis)]|nr:lipid A export permease/ATP-binding protein MsbA [Candidatus Thiodiazotropha sp. (ex Semelilucina semeliformis)]
MTSKQLYLRLLSYVRPYRKTFILSILFTVLLALTEWVLPALFKPLLDGSFVEKDMQTIRLMPLALIGIFILRGIASYTSTMAIQWVANKVVMDLRNEMFQRLMTLPNRYYDDNPTGTVLSKITFNVQQVASASTEVLIVLVRDSVAVLGLLGWMLYLDWRLTLSILIIGPLIGLLVNSISRRLRQLSESIQSSMGDMTHVLEEGIQGNKVVKLFGGQEYETKRFAHVTNWVRRYHMKRVAAAALASPAGQLIMVLGLAGVVYYASLQSLENKFTVGAFVSFIGALAMMMSPIKKLIRINEQLQPGLAAAQSVFELVDQLPEKDEGDHQVERLQGQIKFDQVCFSYPGSAKPAVDSLSLTIKPGERIALVGPSGGGKTTIANLIPRFYNLDQGSILIDGINIQSMPLSSLRKNIALVSQEVILFNDSVEANIAYGEMRDTPRSQVIDAANAAYAMDFIEKMPEGLDTLIGEKGVRLSGGQRQRLAIARALLKDAPILILDEATSALDNESERYIQQALEALTKDRTTIIIAHRLTTIENADRIVVIANGHIEEIGTHQELMTKKGFYSTLYENLN